MNVHKLPLSRFVILILLLFAFGLRLYQLDQHSLRGDEAATVLYSAMPIVELWELARITDPHPPLFYALLHPWQGLVGEGAWQMRFVGSLASTLVVAALYGLVQQTLRHTGVALLAAGLLAVNPLQIWQAQDLRAYALWTLVAVLSTTLLWRFLHGKSGPIGYVLMTTSAIYLHYYAAFLIAFEGMFVLLNARRFWARRWQWLISQVAIAVLILPSLYLAWGHLGHAAGGIEVIPLSEVLRLTSTALLTGFTLDRSTGLLMSLISLPVWFIGIIWLMRQNWTLGTFWSLFLLIPVGGVIMQSIDRPFFKERFLIQAQPAFALLLAAGIVAFGAYGTRRLSNWRDVLRGVLAIGYVTLLVGINLHTLNNYFHEPTYAKATPWRLYHDYVTDRARPGDVMLTNFPEASVSYYSPNDLPFYVVPDERNRSAEYRIRRTAEIATAYERIWLLPLFHKGFDAEGDVPTWLDRHADRIDQIFFPTYNLNLYLSPTVLHEAMIRQPTPFAHGVSLLGYQVWGRDGKSKIEPAPECPTDAPCLLIEPEKSFTLSLYWQATASIDQPYTVFVHLIAEDGFNRVGQDNQPVWGGYPTTAWQPNEQITDRYTLELPAGTPPQPHRLRVGWYQTESGARVGLANGSDEWVILDSVVQVKAKD